jgi:hypothetical protein
MKGKGWHLEPVRHSRARRFGSAGGKMPKKFNASGVAYSQGTQYWRTPQGKVVRVGSSPLLRAYPKIMKQFADFDKKIDSKKDEPFAEWNKGKVSFSDLKKDNSIYNYSEADEIADAKKEVKKLKARVKEESATAKKYASEGYLKQAKDEAEHDEFFKKKANEIKETPAQIEADYNSVSKKEYQTFEGQEKINLSKKGEQHLIEFEPKIFYHSGFNKFYKNIGEGDYYEIKNDKNLRKKYLNKTHEERIRTALGLPAKPIPQKWFMVGKDLKEIAIQKPSKKKIDSLNKKGFAVSRITEIDGKTEIFTFSPRTREEAIKQENRLFG